MVPDVGFSVDWTEILNGMAWIRPRHRVEVCSGSFKTAPFYIMRGERIIPNMRRTDYKMCSFKINKKCLTANFPNKEKY